MPFEFEVIMHPIFIIYTVVICCLLYFALMVYVSMGGADNLILEVQGQVKILMEMFF